MKKTQYLGIVVLMFALTACGRLRNALLNGGDADETSAELTVGAIGGIANSTEGNGYQAYHPIEKSTVTAMLDFLSPVKPAFAAGLCPTLHTASCGEDGVMVLTYEDCTFGGPGIWNGSQKLQFSSLAVCQARSNAYGIPTSGSLLRTFGGNQYDNPTTRTVLNRQVILDTETAAGYENPVSGGTLVEFSQDSDSRVVRTVSVNGINLLGNFRDRNIWNVSISTEVPLKIVGVAANKEIPEGKVVVQHNKALFSAASSVVEPLRFESGCCHPVAGAIETVFSGSKSGSERVIFDRSCGEATIRALDGSEAPIQLRHCF